MCEPIKPEHYQQWGLGGLGVRGSKVYYIECGCMSPGHLSYITYDPQDKTYMMMYQLRQYPWGAYMYKGGFYRLARVWHDFIYWLDGIKLALLGRPPELWGEAVWSQCSVDKIVQFIQTMRGTEENTCEECHPKEPTNEA